MVRHIALHLFTGCWIVYVGLRAFVPVIHGLMYGMVYRLLLWAR